MPSTPPTPIARDLLAWYDRHRRDLPWRAKPGVPSDPYHVWLSEIMLQQTTVAAVKPYFARFLSLWPDVRALARAETEAVMTEWAGLGYYARARNLHACAKAVAARPGAAFPDTEAGLRGLPGVGDYTAAAIAAIAFGRPAAVVDGNVERVMSRLETLESLGPALKKDARERVARLVPADRPGDFAQAMMDLGATICTPRTPACVICPLAGACRARRQGDPAAYPRRAPKASRPTRHGAVAVIRRQDGAVLIRARPPRGLLGGMIDFVGTEWTEGPPEAAGLAALAEDGFEPCGRVEHVFTHFALMLDVYAGRTRRTAPPDGYRWSSAAHVEAGALASLMRKVWERAARTGREDQRSSPSAGRASVS